MRYLPNESSLGPHRCIIIKFTKQIIGVTETVDAVWSGVISYRCHLMWAGTGSHRNLIRNSQN